MFLGFCGGGRVWIEKKTHIYPYYFARNFNGRAILSICSKSWNIAIFIKKNL
jgi:hypothetical protein